MYFFFFYYCTSVAWIIECHVLNLNIRVDICAVSQVVLVVKNLPAIAGDRRDMGSISGLRRSPGEGNGYPLQ